MSEDVGRTARIEARISVEGLLAVKRAAELQGRSVSDFVVTAAQAEANRTIEQAQIIRVSVEDQRMIAAALETPPAANEALRGAAAAYRRLVVDVT